MVTESHCRGLMSLNKDNFNTVSAVYSQLSTHNVHICKAAGKFLSMTEVYVTYMERRIWWRHRGHHAASFCRRTCPCLAVEWHWNSLSRPTPAQCMTVQFTKDNNPTGHSKTSEQRTVIQQCSDSYTGCWWVGCYIWYSEEGPGWAAAPPSTLLAVTNVTTHPSTAVYQLHIIRCGTVIASALLLLVCVSFTIIGQPRNSVLIHRV